MREIKRPIRMRKGSRKDPEVMPAGFGHVSQNWRRDVDLPAGLMVTQFAVFIDD
jgi:hypothetical protein